MSLIRQMRGGKDYDSQWHTRMKGTGPYAEMIARRFQIAVKRFGLNQESRPLLLNKIQTAGTRGGSAAVAVNPSVDVLFAKRVICPRLAVPSVFRFLGSMGTRSLAILLAIVLGIIVLGTQVLFPSNDQQSCCSDRSLLLAGIFAFKTKTWRARR